MRDRGTLSAEINEKLDELNELKAEKNSLDFRFATEEDVQTIEDLISYVCEDLENIISNQEISGIFTNDFYINSQQ